MKSKLVRFKDVPMSDHNKEKQGLKGTVQGIIPHVELDRDGGVSRGN